MSAGSAPMERQSGPRSSVRLIYGLRPVQAHHSQTFIWRQVDLEQRRRADPRWASLTHVVNIHVWLESRQNVKRWCGINEASRVSLLSTGDELHEAGQRMMLRPATSSCPSAGANESQFSFVLAVIGY